MALDRETVNRGFIRAEHSWQDQLAAARLRRQTQSPGDRIRSPRPAVHPQGAKQIVQSAARRDRLDADRAQTLLAHPIRLGIGTQPGGKAHRGLADQLGPTKLDRRDGKLGSPMADKPRDRAAKDHMIRTGAAVNFREAARPCGMEMDRVIPTPSINDNMLLRARDINCAPRAADPCLFEQNHISAFRAVELDPVHIRAADNIDLRIERIAGRPCLGEPGGKAAQDDLIRALPGFNPHPGGIGIDLDTVIARSGFDQCGMRHTRAEPAAINLGGQDPAHRLACEEIGLHSRRRGEDLAQDHMIGAIARLNHSRGGGVIKDHKIIAAPSLQQEPAILIAVKDNLLGRLGRLAGPDQIGRAMQERHKPLA